MISQLWFPWALETPIARFDGATVREALRHLEAAPKGVVVWVLNAHGTTDYALDELNAMLGDLARIHARGVERLVFVSDHPFADMLVEPVREVTKIAIKKFATRDGAYRWLASGCKG